MNLIQSYVSDTLKTALDILNADNITHFSSSNPLINHKLLYCNKWKENKYEYLVDLLKNECPHLANTFANNTLVQINFINAPPDCNEQLFHIDYLGDSISYFIPLVELSDLNGTEYLYFYDNNNYFVYYTLMLEMSEKYFTKKEVIEYMNIKGLYFEKDYCFKCANGPSYSIIEMPNYVYHRGQKNKTGYHRIMLNILFSINNSYEYPIDEIILDSEVDEKQRINYILKKRMNT